ncbi:MAG TPA: UbiD family decarboxylase [Nitrososphaeria archaeon]|nr:UbiD family decarboxylase [Nitrososphaeria archaeon]
MVGFREFLLELERLGLLARIDRRVSTRFEIAAVIKKLDSRPVIFTNISGHEDFKLAANIAANRSLVARSINVSEGELLNRLIYAIENPSKGEVVADAPCQEIIIRDPDLRKLPFLIFGERDGGPYLTAGIVIAYDPEYGFNASYHRLMLIGKNKLVARILPRHLNTYIERGNRDIAITIGNHPAFMLASAVSWKLGVSELDIANTLKPMKYTRTITNNLLVPADCEVVLEGRVTDEWADEGPFIDVTGTYDIVRKQRVIEINCITMRRTPIFQQILPGGSEHRFLMGTPREATIFREVSKVCDVLDVRLTNGGCNWLHCVIKIRKKSEDDGRRAIEAAFKAHKSLKHVIVVDEDIDISNPSEVEWALATRTQLDKDLILKPGELGSSLDPSADQVTRITCKAGVDATIPFNKEREKFVRAKIPGEDELKLEDYIQ